MIRSMTKLQFTIAFLFVSLIVNFQSASAQTVKRNFKEFDLSSLGLTEPFLLKDGLNNYHSILNEDISVDDDITFVENTLDLSLIGSLDLEEVLKKFIDSDSWNNSRNHLDLEHYKLTVVQRPEVIQQIEKFLLQIEAYNQRRYRIEVLMAPSSALDEIPEENLKSNSLPENLIFEVLRRNPSAQFLTKSISTGESVQTIPKKIDSYISDHEINQTGVIPVVNPRVSISLSGTILNLKLFPLEGHPSHYRLDVSHRYTQTSADPQTMKLPAGEAEKIKTKESLVQTTLIGQFGKTHLLGFFNVPSVENPQLKDSVSEQNFFSLVKVTPLFSKPNNIAPNLSVPKIFYAGALFHKLPDRFPYNLASYSLDENYHDVSGVSFGPLKEPKPFVLDSSFYNNFMKSALSDLPVTVRHHFSSKGMILLENKKSALEVNQKFLSSLERKYLKPLMIDLWQGPLTLEEYRDIQKSGSLLGEGWNSKFNDTKGLRARAIGVSGQRLAMFSGSRQSYLTDVETVSGGTGLTIVEVPDPVIRYLIEGLSLGIKATFVSETNWAHLEVQGGYARPAKWGNKGKVRTSNEVSLKSEKSGEDQQVQLKPKFLELDLPEEDLEHWNHTVTVESGKPVLLNVLPDPKKPGQVRALIGRIQKIEF